MRILVCGGSGEEGIFFARDLIKYYDDRVSEVIIAGRDLEKANKAVEVIGSKKASARSLDISNTKALAFLNYMRTLEFVSFKESNLLTEEQKQFVDVGIDALEQGKSQTHNEVMNETQKRYPNLFKWAII